ncbi:MAG TPA: sialate O-acetylesterase [Opitutaceae bacterium]|nr:sialate O-acetylesterase [Opitutaceae bacterium]
MIKPLVLALVALIAPAASARVHLAGIFQDHMVLQRGAEVPVWGRAAPGEKVTVQFGGQTRIAAADAMGRWRVALAPLAASTTPRDLLATGGTGEASDSVRIADVLVGEVWLCSGQSNMEFPMSWLEGTPYEGDLTSANDPLIREGRVRRQTTLEPADDAKVTWAVCSPHTVSEFSATAFYFARGLQQELGVPIGLVVSAWGGTSAESWTSRDALDAVPEFRRRADAQIRNLASLPAAVARFPQALATWRRTHDRTDPGDEDEANRWAAPDADVSDWSHADLRGTWKNLGLPDGGVAWVRKIITIDSPPASGTTLINFGPRDREHVTVYWNGTRLPPLGGPPFSFVHPLFQVPARLVQRGPNVLAMRFDVETPGVSPLGRPVMQLGIFAFGVHELDDDGLVRIVRRYPPLSAAALTSRPVTPQGDPQHTSSMLFNGMIAPLVPFAFRGCIWYQGESDANRAGAYRSGLPLMLRDWRRRWGRDFPIIIQQLPNWGGYGPSPGWAELREAQELTSRTLPDCWLSVAIDIGDHDNIHPKNKRELGRRLGLVALARVYGKPVADSGPNFRAMTKHGTSLTLVFRHDDALRSLDGHPLAGFSVAGSDRRFVPAEARIVGDTVVVASPAVTAPVAARYAFANDPVGLNFSDASGLPAHPFRTDQWSAESATR